MADPRSESSAIRRFSRAAQTYDAHADVQSWLAAKLMTRILPRQAPRAIVEVGCGTGILTRMLFARWPDCPILATDPAEKMLDVARANLRPSPSLRFLCRGADQLDTPADWIVSNAALHWVPELAKTIRHLWGLVQPGGGLAFTVMTQGTLGEIHSMRSELFPGATSPRQMPEHETVLRCRPPDAMADGEESLIRTIHYSSAQEMWKALHRSGVTRGPFTPTPPLTPRQLHQLSTALAAKHGEKSILPVTYCMACVVWHKPISSYP